ncbi:MAG: SDR family NAD(P)-dependent oxidoreductase, partial [Pseudomonadota bacterium]
GESFAGKTAIVTGAASGIGAAVAAMFRAAGASVAAADLAYRGFAVSDAAGRRHAEGHCDVGDERSVTDFVREVGASLGPADILVNNAGIFPMQPFLEIDYAGWQRVLRTNLDSMYLTCRETLPAMQARGWGRVINMASNSYHMGLPQLSHYMASKGGVIGFTRSIAAEFGEFGITANCIAPNFTRTEGTRDTVEQRPELVEQIVASQAIHRVAEPDDLLGTVRFLAGPDSAFLTGQTLVVDGGTINL